MDPKRSPVPRRQGEVLHPDAMTLEGQNQNLMMRHALRIEA